MDIFGIVGILIRSYLPPIRENPLWLIGISFLLFSIIAFFLLLKNHVAYEELSVQPRVTVAPTPTLLPIAIASLQKKTYSSEAITKVRSVASGDAFTSEVVSYTVDGLKEYALLDIPTRTKPKNGYPVVILDHGYIVPSQYDTVNSYGGVTDFFANSGYIVLKPDYRGNGNSQGAQDPLQRYNYPVDVVTLLTSVKNIPEADTAKIYLWGHSMGGEVTLEVMEILGKQPLLVPGLKAAVLWAPVTDPALWFSESNLKRIPEAQLTPFPYATTFQILGTPSDTSPIWQSINPLRYLADIRIPVQLSHGTADQTVPYSWSVDLDKRMHAVGQDDAFISYAGADHNMSPDSAQALQNNLQFFKSRQ